MAKLMGFLGGENPAPPSAQVTTDGADVPPPEAASLANTPEGWATSKGRFWTPTKTVPRLAAGVYTVGTSDRIGTFLDHVRVVKDELIHLPDMGARVVLDEIRLFLERKDRYKARGMLHKRGIIMEGPPGSGKTSNAELLVDMFIKEVDGLVILTPQIGHIHFGLEIIRQREPTRPILVVMEDIDAAIRNGNEEHLLNLLDGQYQHDGVVIVATTNHLDKLPDRIANRPSRFDLVVTIGMPSYDGRVAYLKAKEPTFSAKKIEAIAERTAEYSVAHLKELLLLTEVYEMPLERALARIEAIRKRKLVPEQAAFQVEQVGASVEDL